MTEFRFSRTLDKLGISYNTQGLIYFLCVNAKRLPERDKAVLNMCLEVAGEDYQALYKFLTDSSVNQDRKSTRLNSSHRLETRMPSSA